MVFENLTLVELNLENSRFSASRGGSDDAPEPAAEEPEETAQDDSGGRGAGGVVAVLALIAVGVAIAIARRRRSAGEQPAEADQITIEDAAEQ